MESQNIAAHHGKSMAQPLSSCSIHHFPITTRAALSKAFPVIYHDKHCTIANERKDCNSDERVSLALRIDPRSDSIIYRKTEGVSNENDRGDVFATEVAV